jgi:hypothetical protein
LLFPATWAADYFRMMPRRYSPRKAADSPSYGRCRGVYVAARPQHFGTIFVTTGALYLPRK